MIINDELFFNVLQDFKKKDISVKDKGSLVKIYCDENKISQREFGRRFSIPHSTVQDWISGRQLNKGYGRHNELNSLLDRIVFVLSSKNVVIDDKTKRLVSSLRDELERLSLL